MKNPLTFQKGGRSVAIILLALVCAIVLNLAVGALPTSVTKLDTTAMKMFDLSEQTLETLSDLDSEVEIYWIVRTGAEDTYIQTLLGLYSEKSGNLKVTKKDPDVAATFVQQYYDAAEVQDNSLVVKRGDRYQCVPYGDIFVVDQMEMIMTGQQNFTFEGENALTGAIIYVTNENIPKVYALTNHGETELPEHITNGIKRQGMELLDLNMLTSDGIPANADGILISGPQRDISESEKAQLSAYLKAGGSLLYLTGDPTVGNEQPNLDSLLKEYGIIPRTGMVGETETNHYYTGSPALLLPDIYAHAITNPLREENYQVIMPYSKSLKVDSERPDTVKVTELLLTTKDAFAKQGDNKEAVKEAGDLEGPFAVAAASQEQNTGARVVCIASAAQYFLDENFNAMVGGGNQDLFLNALSWMCEYDDGITIHSKSLQYETLTIDNTASSMWITILLLIPVACVVFGAVRFVQRKRR